MKKMLKNKKGFTLIELLAVIVVLAIIMVIATQQVTKTIADARQKSWDSSCKMLEKEAKNRYAEHLLNPSNPDATCTTDCITKYSVSSDDYDSFTVTKSGNTYTLSVHAKANGKFDGVTNATCTASWDTD